MAEEYEKYKRFEYRMNSNLVLQREGPLPSLNEPTGESESLVGRIKYKMGDKVEYNKPKRTELSDRSVKSHKRKENFEDKKTKKLKKNLKEKSVLNVNLQDIFLYKPTTRYTEQTYSKILGFIRDLLGDNTAEIINSAANEILNVLKSNEEQEDKERNKEEVENVLDMDITDEQFLFLNNLVKEIYDFNKKEENNDLEEEDGIEQDGGVAVVFEEEDDFYLLKNKNKAMENGKELTNFDDEEIDEEEIEEEDEEEEDEDDEEEDDDDEDDEDDDDDDDDDEDEEEEEDDKDEDEEDEEDEENEKETGKYSSASEKSRKREANGDIMSTVEKEEETKEKDRKRKSKKKKTRKEKKDKRIKKEITPLKKRKTSLKII